MPIGDTSNVVTVIFLNESLSRSKADIKIVSWTSWQRPEDNDYEHNDKNDSRAQVFAMYLLGNDKHHPHMKMNLAEDY